MSFENDKQEETGPNAFEDRLSEDFSRRLVVADFNQSGIDAKKEEFKNPLPSVYTRTTSGPAPDGLGTGLFASASIGAGGIVLNIQKPFVAVLDTPRLEDTCSGCFGKNQLGVNETPLKACTGCRVVKYCDKTCQAKDWKFAHSLECQIFKKLVPRVLPSNARAVLRMALRSARQKYSDQELDLFLKLETHIREICDRNADQWERILLSAKAVKAYSGIDMKEETISAYGAKLDLNSFNLSNALYDRLGLYLHPYAALINHSCDYNSVVGFDGDELLIKAIRPINEGEQIFISYIDATNPYKIRQRELSDRYFFDCRCSKCKKGRDGPEDRFLGTPHGISALENAELEAYALMESASSSSDIEPLEAVHRLESAMKLLYRTSSWPITRQPFVSLRDELIASLLSAGKFNTAFIQAAIRFLHIDPKVYPRKGHPIRHVHAWALAKIAMHLSEGLEPDPSDPVALNDFQLDFNLIVYFVIYLTVAEEPESCTVPSFQKMVRSALGPYNNGPGPMDISLKDAIKKEWDKLSKVVNIALEKEKR